MPEDEEWIKLGEVGVDSGQLLVCDPCYIASQWKDEKPPGHPQLRDTKTGEVVDSPVKSGKTYESEYKDGKTYNKAIREGTLEEIPTPESHTFSYHGCCTSSVRHMGGQLNYLLGHAGAGVAFSSGLGDGTYDVLAKVKDIEGWGRRICEIRIVLINDSELEELDDEDYDDKKELA